MVMKLNLVLSRASIKTFELESKNGFETKVILCLEFTESRSMNIDIYIFVWLYLKSFFAHGPIKYKWFLQRSVWFSDENQTTTINQDQSGPRINSNEGLFYTLHNSKTETS